MTYAIYIKTPTMRQWTEYMTDIKTLEEANEIAAQAKGKIKVKVVKE